ncbi:MAG TPA: pilus assembly protein TadG-related protein [Gaiellaceae bacterium]|nr:pilus assembly protein TadG-related protein [Gaiellaceae bacterium]
MTSCKRDRGQAAVLTLLFLVALLGAAAAVLDVGSWYREDRRLQASMDAAVLAAAQALPDNPGAANALASEYAEKNGGGLDDVTISTTQIANDTVAATGSRAAPGFFSKVFGIDSVTVNATAKARAGVLSTARYAAPITVNEAHPDLPCAFESSGCYGRQTEISLLNLHGTGSANAAGSFGLLDLRLGGDGSAGNSVVASWMADGYSEDMPLGVYTAVPSTMYNSDPFRDALRGLTGEVVLFPIYQEPILGGGTNAAFTIIGWVGFHVLRFNPGGANAKVTGWFTHVVWEGIFDETGGARDFGAHAVSLIE